MSRLETTPHPRISTVLERIALRMTATLTLQDVLNTITQGLVEELGVAFARIWLLGPGDLCAGCYKAADCAVRERCLHLEASAGMYTDLKGEYRRVPLGVLKIGLIAQGWGRMSTNDLLGDDRFPNKQWIRETGLRSFAGYPLIFQRELLGVLGLFSRRTMTQAEFDRLAVFANKAAICIKNAQLFLEVERLNDQLRAENIYLRDEIKVQHNFEEIVGQTPAIKKVLKAVEMVAPTDTGVLILGETGTGKELIARALHNLSMRRQKALVKVNCAALPATLIDSELFGHEKGACTGALVQKKGHLELADGGTLFLDEIGDLPLELQSKLSRVLQEGEFERVGGARTLRVNVRVIAATSRYLEKAMEAGKFREDLYVQLNVFSILVPPLRERKEDIALLARYFLAKYGTKFGKGSETIPQLTMVALQAYPWPGNVRELENVIERGVIVSPGSDLRLGDWLPAEHSGATSF